MLTTSTLPSLSAAASANSAPAPRTHRVPIDALAVVKRELFALFESVGEGDVHGYAHALAVYEHARRALDEATSERYKLHIDQRMAVLYAALLHDADDAKIFRANRSSSDAASPLLLPNARHILALINFNLVDLVLDMIRLVSFSHNGNAGAPLCAHSTSLLRFETTQRPRWMYIPRDADRVEALGTIGVARCVAYGAQVGRPLYIDGVTTRTRTMRELHVSAAYMHLTGTRGPSTLDYFVSGLIPRSVMASGTRYFAELAAQRRGVVEQVCMHYGVHGTLSHEALLALLVSDARATAILCAHTLPPRA